MAEFTLKEYTKEEYKADMKKLMDVIITDGAKRHEFY